MTVIPFPNTARRDSRLRGIEQCLDSLAAEAGDMGLDLLAHLIAVARCEASEALEHDRRHGS